MRRGSWRALGTLLAVLGMAVAGSIVVLGADDMPPISGLEGDAAVLNSVVAAYIGESLGKPNYSASTSLGIFNVYWYPGGSQWEIYISLGGSEYGYFIAEVDTDTPPLTGWTPYVQAGRASEWGTPVFIVSDDETPGGVAITVDADPSGFLDVVLPGGEGEDPMLAGLLPLAAIHTVGDAVTGGSTTGPIHMYFYSADITSRPESIVLIDHWMASYNRATGEYEFSWDTTGLAPGYYDIRLSFGATAVVFRIELASAE